MFPYFLNVKFECSAVQFYREVIRYRNEAKSILDVNSCFICFSYPAPGRGTVYCFRAISFFVSLSATLRENGWTDLHEIFREGLE